MHTLAWPMAISPASHRLGILDFDLGLTSGDCGRIRRRSYRLVSRSAQSRHGRGAHARRDLGGGARQSARRQSRRHIFSGNDLHEVVPFGAIALIGLFFIDPSHFSEFNPSGKSLLGASAALAPLTMFAFLGLEVATVPAGDVAIQSARFHVRPSSGSPSPRCSTFSARSPSWASCRASNWFTRSRHSPMLRGCCGGRGARRDLDCRYPLGDRRA